MSWKQTIGIVLAVGLIVGLCFAFVFPALYDVDRSGTLEEFEAGKAGPSIDEEKGVLPKLKGVRWESPRGKAPAGKVAEKKTNEGKVAEKEAGRTAQKKRLREEFEALAAGASEERTAASAEAGEPPGESLLEVQDVVWYEQGGYLVVAGSVKNLSDRNIPSVVVHARFLDEAGNPLVSEHSLIDLNPIFPGQVSTFSVAARFQPGINDMELDFTLFSGEALPWSKLETDTEEDIEEDKAAEEGMPEGELMPAGEGLPPDAGYPAR